MQPGTRLGPHAVQERIGAGGMGEVYRARDTKLRRDVAIKVLPSLRESDPERFARFTREARALASLSHPNITTVHEIAEQDGVQYIVMEYVVGRTLAECIPGDGLPTPDVLSYAIQLADALAAAHAAGLVHRDVKPANIMITPDGVVKVLDFGLAKLAGGGEADALDPTVSGVHTRDGRILGTAAYMSPEQAEGRNVDARTDIFSFGVVLYEMMAGQRPFRGDSYLSVLSAIVHEAPPPLRTLRPDVPASLERTVMRCLAKEREARYQSAAELFKDLTGCRSRLVTPGDGIRALVRKPRFVMPALLLLAVLSASIAWSSWHASRVHWARTVALPEIAQLVDQQRTGAALRLARQAERYLPGDPEIDRIRQNFTRLASFRTEPPGADVYIQDYIDAGHEWEYFGRTPLESAVIPTGPLRYRMTKPGFAEVEHTVGGDVIGGPPQIVEVRLDPEGTGPSGMVRVPARPPVEEYWLDKYEVTNSQFEHFVVQGGYEVRDYWKQPFDESGRILPWDDAMDRFRDATGRPGPSTWKFGRFLEGEDDFPVTGVSWHEAAAYCEFAGKSLPTALHWRVAAGVGGNAILQLSNFGGAGPARVGSYQGLGPYGTYDTAGNVREWCWNASGDKRVIQGGAWTDPKYVFSFPEAALPFDRSATNGFRCAKYSNPPDESLMRAVDLLRLPEAQGPLFRLRDRRGDEPVSNAIFHVYTSIHAYDPAELKPTIEQTDESSPYWRKEKVSFQAAYGTERVMAYLYLPRRAIAPFQTVIYFPGTHALDIRSSERLETQYFDFVIRSGRAVVHPIYKGTYERTLGGTFVGYFLQPNVWRDMAVSWSKDLGRSIDYLETRPDIDREKLAYLGLSLGAAEGPRLMALEPRLKAGVLLFGGAWERAIPAEVDPLHFAPRSRTPALMVNGRGDFIFPWEGSQMPLFDLLAAPEGDKRHLVLDGGHAPFNQEVVREALQWLDRYLGRVRTR